MKLLEKIKKLLLYGGLEPEMYDIAFPFARSLNLRFWKFFTAIATVYFAVLYITTYYADSISGIKLLYLVMMLISAIIALKLCLHVKQESRALMPLIFIESAALMIFAAIIGAAYPPEYPAVTFMVLLVILPTATTCRPISMVLMQTISCVLFLALCSRYKTGEVMEMDVVNGICFWGIAMVISMRYGGERLTGYYLRHSLEISNERDSLTLVKNRTAYSKLKQDIDKKIREKSDEPFALVVCDINRLKSINDTFGHEKGDEYIVKNCRAICRIFKHSLVFRIVGDEFLVYLTGTDYNNRNMLLSTCAELCRKDGFGCEPYDKVNFAAGMAEFEPGKDSFSAVYKRADEKLYKCKKQMHAEAAESREADVQPQQQTVVPSPGKKKLLVVRSRDSELCALLEDQYEVIRASNGRGALEQLAESCDSITLIIAVSDQNPGNTYSFLQTLADHPLYSTIPAIVIAESADAVSEEKCFERGAVDFICKPYNAGALTARLQSIIRGREYTARLHAVEYDDLTGLYSRQAFFHYAEQLIRNNPGVQFDIVVSDIDDFRSINETYGDETGDKVLQGIGDFMRRGMTPQSVVGRYGSDKFVSIFPHREDVDWDTVNKIYTEMQNDLPRLDFRVENKLGIYEKVDKNLPVSAMCDRAFMALRTVKHQYGKKIAFYNESIQRIQDRKFIIEQSMREAYDNGQFSVYYQPKHEAASGRLVGAEALIRWNHPILGFLPPSEFIPLFEKNGFITYADYYVWKRTCENLGKWKAEGLRPVPVSVNTSRLDYEFENHLEMIMIPVRDAGIDTSLLHLEVTESLFSSDLQSVADMLSELRKAGFKVELDDFGTGYSSLNTLGVLPLDVLKLDISFMRQIYDKRRLKVLAASISLAHTLNLKTVAEGVETEEQVRLLKELNCDDIQGYYYSKPLPEDEFADYIKACMAREKQNRKEN